MKTAVVTGGSSGIALADGAPGMKPPPVNVLGLFAHHPALAKAFLAYNCHLTGRSSTVDRRTR